jgi:hypothetical protein
MRILLFKFNIIENFAITEMTPRHVSTVSSTFTTNAHEHDVENYKTGETGYARLCLYYLILAAKS